jgi:hypothetical protein
MTVGRHLEKNTAFPFAAFLYTCSTVHCMPVSLAQGGSGLPGHDVGLGDGGIDAAAGRLESVPVLSVAAGAQRS